ncbi:hypothetical protein AZZ74_005246, partial [Klebsiella pneumoniae]
YHACHIVCWPYQAVRLHGNGQEVCGIACR